MVTSGLRVSHLPSDEELGREWGSWERGSGQRGAFTAAPPIPGAEVRENEKLHSVATAITPPMSGLDGTLLRQGQGPPSLPRFGGRREVKTTECA